MLFLCLLSLWLAFVGSSTAALSGSVCVWRPDTNSCAWNLAYPLVSLSSSSTTDLGELDTKSRTLVLAGFALEFCGEQADQPACQAASFNGSNVCQWRPADSSSPPPFLTTSTTRCMPKATLLEEYLSLTAPDACPEDATLGVCATDYKCVYDDHIEHAHCIVDMMYVQNTLGGASSKLAVAANQAQHLCSPATVWPEFESPRPRPLTQTECEQQGTFTMPEGWSSRLAAAAGFMVPQVPASVQPSPPPRPPSPSPSPPRQAVATVAGCQLISSTTCAPTLLSLASAENATSVEPDTRARDLMGAISSALECVSNTTSADVMTQQQCTVTALSATPTVLINTFSPSCTSLSESACRARPGCTLKAHGDHSDCVQSRAYVSEYLGGGAYAANIQAKADACQVSLASCGMATVTITADMMRTLSTVLEGLGDHGDDHDHDEGDHDAHGDHDDDHQSSGKFGEETLGLRVASIFIILAAGLLGCALPLVFKAFLATGTLAHRLLQSLSAGVIISLALIHIGYHAVVEMTGLDEVEEQGGGSGHEGHNHRRALLTSDVLNHSGRRLTQDDDFVYESHGHPYPIGMAVIVFGFVLMILFEHLAAVVHKLQPADDPLSAVCKAHRPGGAMHEGHMQHGGHMQPMPAGDEVSMHDLAEKGKELTPTSTTNTPTSTTNNPTSTTGAQSRLIMAVLFELGCVAHSFIIGMSLGVSLTFSDIRPLLIGLCFHQFLEGISLGSVLLYSGLARIKQFIMVAIYAITCPLGVAVGIAIAYTYDSHSVTARAVQGTFNGVAAGMLLYLGMALVLGDLWHLEYKRPLHRLMSFGALCLGVAAMAVLGIWA